jgi:hypothetical protein
MTDLLPTLLLGMTLGVAGTLALQRRIAPPLAGPTPCPDWSCFDPTHVHPSW